MAHPPSSRFTPLNVHWTFTLWERSFTFVSFVKNRSHGLFHLFKFYSFRLTADAKIQSKTFVSGSKCNPPPNYLGALSLEGLPKAYPPTVVVLSLKGPPEPARPLWGSPALFEARSLRCRLRTSTLWDRSLAHLKVPRTFTLTGSFVHPSGSFARGPFHFVFFSF